MTIKKSRRNNKFLSPNFSIKNRPKKNIKHIVIHYTGMQSEVESIKKLCNPKSGVSSHFFIKRSGKILRLVPEEKIAWHAGKSKWGKRRSYCHIELLESGTLISWPRSLVKRYVLC